MRADELRARAPRVEDVEDDEVVLLARGVERGGVQERHAGRALVVDRLGRRHRLVVRLHPAVVVDARDALELLLARREAVEEVRLLLDEVAAHALRLCAARVQDRVALRVDDRLAQLEGERRLRALGVRALEAEAAGDAALPVTGFFLVSDGRLELDLRRRHAIGEHVERHRHLVLPPLDLRRVRQGEEEREHRPAADGDDPPQTPRTWGGASPRRTRENRKRVCASAWSLYADSLGVVASAYLSNAASDSVAVSSEGSPEVHSRGPEPDRPTRAALRTRRPARGRIA